jgi:hypothetical protein
MESNILVIIGRSLVAVAFVVAGTYVLVNGNHYILCPCCYVAAYGIATDRGIIKITTRS